MKYKILNSLDLNDYKWVFNLNSIERPSNKLLEEKFKNESQTVKNDLKELINLWDFIEDVKKYLELDPYMLYMQEDNVLSVQQGLNLKWETRFFVIASKRAGQSLVCSELTPLHKDFEIPKEFLQVYPDILSFSKEVMGALRDGNSLFSQTYVLDIAWDEDKGKPIVLELNPIHNSGLYATKTNLLVSLAKENPGEFLLRV